MSSSTDLADEDHQHEKVEYYPTLVIPKHVIQGSRHHGVRHRIARAHRRSGYGEPREVVGYTRWYVKQGVDSERVPKDGTPAEQLGEGREYHGKEGDRQKQPGVA